MPAGVINKVGKTFVDIRDLLTPDEKEQVALQWNNGVKKNHAGIDIFLRHNLVECIQPRRLDPNIDLGFKKRRHMLCTRNLWFAKRLVKLRGGTMKVKQKRSAGWYKQKKLILVWDIIFNDWRMIDVEIPTMWRLLDFVPFNTEEHYQYVANAWTTSFKKIKYPDSPGARSYCNFLRKGI